MALLAGLPEPLSLIEVGASADLCLFPDRYSYQYDDRAAIKPENGRSRVLLRCVTSGDPPIPGVLPTVAHRAGVDLNPLDVTDEDDMWWLESLVWLGQPARVERLRAAVAVARRDPPQLVAGDLATSISEQVHAAPQDTTVVVYHSAVLGYVAPEARLAFENLVGELPCHWIANEGPGVVKSHFDQLSERGVNSGARFVVALDGTVVALAGPHGQSLDWLLS